MKQQGRALPILSYHTGYGWAQHGHARSETAAARFIRRNLISSETKALLDKHGFSLLVSKREKLMQEINGGPIGYIWSVGKAVRTT